jgi:hypothetical protein
MVRNERIGKDERTVGGSCEPLNELSFLIKDKEFRENLGDY